MRARPLLPALALLASLASALGAPGVQAGGIPTVDAISNANLVALLTEAQSTLLQLEKQYDALSEVRREIAGLVPLVADLERIAGSIEALDDGSFSGAADLAARLAAITADFGLKEPEDLFAGDVPDPDGRGAVYERRLDATRGTLVVAEAQFDAAASAYDDYQLFQDRLGSESEDLKSALDLNTRVAIANGEMLTRLLQLLATSERMKATERASALRVKTVNEIRFGRLMAPTGDTD